MYVCILDEKIHNTEKISVVFFGGGGFKVRILMSVTNMCKGLVMRICKLKYRRPLSVIIPDPQAPICIEQGTPLVQREYCALGSFVGHVDW